MDDNEYMSNKAVSIFTVQHKSWDSDQSHCALCKQFLWSLKPV